MFCCSSYDDEHVHSLRLISPVIKDHGIDYESGKFQDKINDGSLTLARTEVREFQLNPMIVFV